MYRELMLHPPNSHCLTTTQTTLVGQWSHAADECIPKWKLLVPFGCRVTPAFSNPPSPAQGFSLPASPTGLLHLHGTREAA